MQPSNRETENRWSLQVRLRRNCGSCHFVVCGISIRQCYCDGMMIDGTSTHHNCQVPPVSSDGVVLSHPICCEPSSLPWPQSFIIVIFIHTGSVSRRGEFFLQTFQRILVISFLIVLPPILGASLLLALHFLSSTFGQDLECGP